MKFWSWLQRIWFWLMSGTCYTCKAVVLRRHLHEYSPFHSGRFCGECWRKMKQSDNEAWEQHLLQKEVEVAKRRLRARRIAERELSRDTYRDASD